jgi:hypothetical protein
VNASIDADRAEKEKEKQRRHTTRKTNAAVRSGAVGEEVKMSEEALKLAMQPQK